MNKRTGLEEKKGSEGGREGMRKTTEGRGTKE